MVKRRKLAVVASFAALALVAVACGDDDGEGGDGEPTGAAGLEGTIVVSGSSTVEPISALVASATPHGRSSRRRSTPARRTGSSTRSSRSRSTASRS